MHENSIGHFCDSLYVDGLYDVSVHAAFKGFLSVFFKGVCRHGDGWNIQNKLPCIVADWRSNVELPVSKQNGKPVQNVELTLCQVHDIQPSRGQVIFV